MTKPDLHQCRSMRLCRNKTREGKGWKPAVTEEPKAFCDKCSRRIRAAYREALADYEALQSVIGDKISTDTVKVAGTPTPPMPLNGTVIALSAALSEQCEESVKALADVLNVSPQLRQKARGWPVKERNPIIQASKLIPEHVQKLAWSDAGTVAALAVWQTHQQIEQFIGEGKQRTRLAMPCPALGCGRRTLGIDNGSTDVTCQACGGRWSEREYNWLSTLLVAEVTREEHDVLEWLLAEQKHINDSMNVTMRKVERLSNLTDKDVEGFSAATVLRMLREILSGD